MDALNKEELLDLDEFEGLTDEGQEEMKERFKITSLESANWAFRKLKAINKNKMEVNLLADEEMKRIKKWQEKELSQYERSENFFNFLLEEYYRDQRELDPKFTLSTPYGKVSGRKQQSKWIYDDEKLTKWLAENDGRFIKVTYTPKKAELKKEYIINDDVVVTKDGEIVEGIAIKEQEDSVTIKVVD